MCWSPGPTDSHSGQRFKKEGGKVRLHLKVYSSCCVHYSLGWRPREKAADQKLELSSGQQWMRGSLYKTRAVELGESNRFAQHSRGGTAKTWV